MRRMKKIYHLGVVGSEEELCMCGAEYMVISVPYAQFYYESKTFLKKKKVSKRANKQTNKKPKP